MDTAEFRKVLREARELDESAGQLANDLAIFVERHIRDLSRSRLSRLKKALHKFNMHTGNWKD